MKLTDFITKTGISMGLKRAAFNPNMEPNEWTARAFHYRCDFRREAPEVREMTAYFSSAEPLNELTGIDVVLDCLAVDAEVFGKAASLAEWAGEFGYSPDRYETNRVYDSVRRQTEKLRAFLGEEAYRVLLFETERLYEREPKG